jgi:hypothetical protein
MPRFMRFIEELCQTLTEDDVKQIADSWSKACEASERAAARLNERILNKGVKPESFSSGTRIITKLYYGDDKQEK